MSDSIRELLSHGLNALVFGFMAWQMRTKPVFPWLLGGLCIANLLWLFVVV